MTEGVEIVLLKACRGCGRLIPQTMNMCERCEEKQQSRHVVYNNTRRDPRSAEFYLSKEWRAMRPIIMSVYDYVDIYALYVEHQLITLKESDPIHHIIELEQDWEQRLNPLNLIPLSHRTHNTITALYKQSNASMKATQTRLRSLYSWMLSQPRSTCGWKCQTYQIRSWSSSTLQSPVRSCCSVSWSQVP